MINQINFSDKTLTTPVLDELSAKLGQSLIYIAPPTSNCFYCKKPLNLSNDPIQVQLHTRLGTFIATKYSLRCKECVEARQHGGNIFGEEYDITYSPTKYGNKKDGLKFYPTEYNVNLVSSSDCCYFEDLFVKQYFAEFHHGWLSSQAKTESFNEVNRGTYQSVQTLKFLSLNPSVGKKFLQQKNEEDQGDKDDEDDDDERVNMSRMHELKTKSLSQAMVNHEIMSELRENNLLNTTQLGPIKKENKTSSFKET